MRNVDYEKSEKTKLLVKTSPKEEEPEQTRDQPYR